MPMRRFARLVTLLLGWFGLSSGVCWGWVPVAGVGPVRWGPIWVRGCLGRGGFRGRGLRAWWPVGMWPVERAIVKTGGSGSVVGWFSSARSGCSRLGVGDGHAGVVLAWDISGESVHSVNAWPVCTCGFAIRTGASGRWSGVSGRFAGPCGDHWCEHEVQVAVREVREMRLDLVGRRQFRG